MVFQARDAVGLGSSGGSGVGEKWVDLGLCLEALLVMGWGVVGAVGGKDELMEACRHLAWEAVGITPGLGTVQVVGGSLVRTVTEVPGDSTSSSPSLG